MYKRGTADNTLMYTVMFIILNIVFFVVIMTFAYRESNGTSTYEQALAKEIAFMIDQAQPGMTFSLNITEADRLARNNNWQGELVTIDNNQKQVFVHLSAEHGYNMGYFTNYTISHEIKTQGNQRSLRIIIEGRT